VRIFRTMSHTHFNFYDCQRRHRHLDSMSPEAFESVRNNVRSVRKRLGDTLDALAVSSAPGIRFEAYKFYRDQPAAENCHSD